MTQTEVEELKGSNKNLSTTESKNKQSVVKGEINEHRDKWNKIKEFKNGKNN